MKTSARCIILLTLFFTSASARSEELKTKHWYQVFLQGDKQESFIGTSTLSPEEFSHMLSGTELVRLEDLRIQGGTIGWASPDGYLAKPQIFINPRSVIYFFEWAADPKAKDSKPK